MINRTSLDRGDRGVALIMAIVVLAVCMMLGMSYVRYMELERDNTAHVVNDSRARAAAEAGLQAAIASIGQTLQAGGTIYAEFAPTEFTEVVLPDYAPSTETGLVKQEGRTFKAKVWVADEAARINVNFAPASVLAAALGVEPNRARDIRSALPRIPGDDGGYTQSNARWLTTVEELVARGPLTADEFAKVDQDILTVYTVPDPANPAGFINLNSAPPAVLSAVLGVSAEVAQRMQDQTFTTPAEVAAAAGKDLTAFNYAPPADAPGNLPKELALQSRTFRIVSRGTVEMDGAVVTGGTMTVEAVVQFDAAGQPQIRYWNETPGDESPAQNAPAPANPA